MIKNIFCLFLSLLIICAGNIFAGEDVKDSKLINIIPSDKIKYGCGCSYSFKGNNSKEYQPIFQSELDFSKAAIYLNGELVSLESIKTYNLKSPQPKVGDKFLLQFRHNDFLIEFNNTVTFVCPPNTEGGCEVTRFEADLTVSNEKIKEIYSVKGEYGC